jgi:hypothetical protein
MKHILQSSLILQVILLYALISSAFAGPDLISPINNAEDQPLSITLEFSNEGARTYYIQLSKEEDFSTLIHNGVSTISSTASTLTYTISNLENSTEYYWRVGTDTWSNTYRFKTVAHFTEIYASQFHEIELVNPNDTIIEDEPFVLEWIRGSLNGEAEVQISKDNQFNKEDLLLLGNITIRGISHNVHRAANSIQDNAVVGKPGDTFTSTVLNNDISWYKINATADLDTLYLYVSGPMGSNTVTTRKSMEVHVFRNEEIVKNTTVSIDRTNFKIPNEGSNEYYIMLGPRPDPQFSPISYNNSGKHEIVTSRYDLESGRVRYITNIISESSELFWRVREIENDVAGPWSETVSFNYEIYEQPMPPQLVLPDNNSLDQDVDLTFAWTSVNDIEEYEIQLAESIQFNEVVYEEVTYDTAITVSDQLEKGREYFWRVKSLDNRDNSEWSEVWSFTTIMNVPDVISLQEPPHETIHVDVISEFSWIEMEGSDFYQLQLSINAEFSDLIVDRDSISANSLIIKDSLAYGSVYWWRVRGINSGGEGEWSEPWSFTTTISPPDAISLLIPANEAIEIALLPELSWEEMEDVVFYQFQLSIDGSFAELIVYRDSLGTHSFRLPDSLEYNTEYWWRVRGKNSDGIGIWSEPWSFRTISPLASVEQKDTPVFFELRQNYPNPFNPSTQISYSVPEQAHIRLAIYNMLGQRVVMLVNEEKSAGRYEVSFNASNLSSGIYLYRMQADGYSESRQMMLLK